MRIIIIICIKISSSDACVLIVFFFVLSAGESEDFGQKRQPPDVAERSDRVQDLRGDSDRIAGGHAQSHRPRLGLDAHVHGDRRQRRQ